MSYVSLLGTLQEQRFKSRQHKQGSGRTILVTAYLHRDGPRFTAVLLFLILLDTDCLGYNSEASRKFRSSLDSWSEGEVTTLHLISLRDLTFGLVWIDCIEQYYDILSSRSLPKDRASIVPVPIAKVPSPKKLRIPTRMPRTYPNGSGSLGEVLKKPSSHASVLVPIELSSGEGGGGGESKTLLNLAAFWMILF